MIVEAAVKFGISGRLKGRRKSDDYFVKEVVPVVVPEILSTDAPIAYWWHPTSLQAFQRYEAVRGKLAVRGYEGILYQPVVSLDADLPSVEASTTFVQGVKSVTTAVRLVSGENLKTIAGIGQMTVAGGKAGQFIPQESPNDVDWSAVAEIETSNRDALVAKLSSYYGGMLLIDGILHAPTRSPIIQMDIGRSYGGFTVREQSDFLNRPEFIYCISRFDDAKKIYKQAFKGYCSIEWKLVRPEILDASLIAFDETDYIIRLAARELMKSMAGDAWDRRPYLANEPVDTMVAFAVLRDSMDGRSSTGTIYENLLALEEKVRGQGLHHDQATSVLRLKARLEDDGMVPSIAQGFTP